MGLKNKIITSLIFLAPLFFYFNNSETNFFRLRDFLRPPFFLRDLYDFFVCESSEEIINDKINNSNNSKFTLYNYENKKSEKKSKKPHKDIIDFYSEAIIELEKTNGLPIYSEEDLKNILYFLKDLINISSLKRNNLKDLASILYAESSYGLVSHKGAVGDFQLTTIFLKDYISGRKTFKSIYSSLDKKKGEKLVDYLKSKKIDLNKFNNLLKKYLDKKYNAAQIYEKLKENFGENVVRNYYNFIAFINYSYYKNKVIPAYCRRFNKSFNDKEIIYLIGAIWNGGDSALKILVENSNKLREFINTGNKKIIEILYLNNGYKKSTAKELSNYLYRIWKFDKCFKSENYR